MQLAVGTICAGLSKLWVELEEQSLAWVAGLMLPANELPLQKECEVCHFSSAVRCSEVHACNYEAAHQPQGLYQDQEGMLTHSVPRLCHVQMFETA